jgi:phage baseplate assembly protein W
MATPVFNSYTMLVGNQNWLFNGDYQFDFSVTAGSTLEVLQNIWNCIVTPLGSQYLLRAFGFNRQIIDMPGTRGEMQGMVAALLTVSLWEPRGKITDIQFILTESGTLAGSYAVRMTVEVDLSQTINTILFAAPTAEPVWVLDFPAFDGSSYPTVQLETLSL